MYKMCAQRVVFPLLLVVMLCFLMQNAFGESALDRRKANCKKAGWRATHRKNCHGNINLHNARVVRAKIDVIDPHDPFKRRYQVKTAECTKWAMTPSKCAKFKSEGTATFREGEDFIGIDNMSSKKKYKGYLKNANSEYKVLVADFGTPKNFRSIQKELKKYIDDYDPKELYCPDSNFRCICAFGTRGSRGLRSIGCVNGQPNPLPPIYNDAWTPKAAVKDVIPPCRTYPCMESEVLDWFIEESSLFEKPSLSYGTTRNNSEVVVHDFGRSARKGDIPYETYLMDNGARLCLREAGDEDNIGASKGCVPRPGLLQRSGIMMVAQYMRKAAVDGDGPKYGAKLYLIPRASRDMKTGRVPIAFESDNVENLKKYYKSESQRKKRYLEGFGVLPEHSVIIHNENNIITIKTFYDGFLYPTKCSLNEKDPEKCILGGTHQKDLAMRKEDDGPSDGVFSLPAIEMFNDDPSFADDEPITEFTLTSSGYTRKPFSLRRYSDADNANGISLVSIIAEDGVNDFFIKAQESEESGDCAKYSQPTSSMFGVYNENDYSFFPVVNPKVRAREKCKASKDTRCESCTLCKIDGDENVGACPGVFSVSEPTTRYSIIGRRNKYHRICLISDMSEGWDFISGSNHSDVSALSPSQRGAFCSDIPGSCKNNGKTNIIALKGTDGKVYSTGGKVESKGVYELNDARFAKCKNGVKSSARYCVIKPNPPAELASRLVKLSGSLCQNKKIDQDLAPYIEEYTPVFCTGDLFHGIDGACD